MLEKKKKNKTKILCMLFLVTAIFAGSATAYAKTITDTGKTIRGWTYKFVGEYESSTGKVSGSTKGSFAKHAGCYAELQVYVPNGTVYKYIHKLGENSVSWNSYITKGNNKLRIYHRVYSKKGACTSGGHTIY